jgi:hypothetical protein
VFDLTRAIARGTADVSMLAKPIATLSVTTLVGAFAWRRRHVWLARRFEHDDRLVLLFGMVLAANGVISYPYTKDVIMSPAGALFAIAGFAAARHMLAALPESAPPRIARTFVLAAAVAGSAWSIRVAAAHIELRTAAHAERKHWAYVDESAGLDASETALFHALRNDAVLVHPAPPPLDPPLRALIGTE